MFGGAEKENTKKGLFLIRQQASNKTNPTKKKKIELTSQNKANIFINESSNDS
jgi:hypothetical protein